MDRPFALFLSWTCYGQWLPGDERGYVSNTLRPDGFFDHKHNVPGTSYTRDDEYTREHARRLMHYSEARLSIELATVAAQSLVDAVQSRGWWIIRGAIMANHVHVLLCDCPDDGPEIRRILKGVSQAKLSDAFGANRRWWTSGGFDSYLHSDSSIEEKSHYIHTQPFILVEIIDMSIVIRAVQ